MIAAAWIVLQRVPRSAWLVMLLGFVLAAGAAHAYRAGERHVARASRAAAMHAAIIQLDTARAQLESVLDRAEKARPATISTGRRRLKLRSAVSIVDSQTVSVNGRVDTVPAVLVALLQADDAKIRADSVHQAATDAIPPAIELAELAHAAVDTAMMHQVNAGDVTDAGHGRPVAIAVAVVGTLGVVWKLVHK